MNVLIVDDEALVRTSVRLYLESSGVDRGCIFEAENAVEMLKTLSQRKMDVVFVDIRMPGMDGLSAIEEAFCADTHFYVLTGYEEFEYAQRALRLHVEDYLLKPVHPETIREIVSRERERLRGRHLQEEAAYLEALERQVNDRSGPPVPVPYGLALLALQDVPLPCKTAAGNAVAVSFLGWEYWAFSDRGSFDTSVECFEKEKCYKIVACQTNTTLQVLQMDAWKKLLFEQPHPAEQEGLEEEKNLLTGCFARMVYWAQKDDFEQFGLASAHFIKTMAASRLMKSRKARQRMVSALNHYFSDGGFRATQLEDAVRLLQFYAANALLHTGLSDNMLWQMKGYIDAHYPQKITLPQLAGDFGYTPNYISSAFKKHFGDSPIQYLNRVRLQKACELLVQSNDSVQEIAQKVGFSDANYFSRLFSRQYHLSPAAYRKKKIRG